MTSFRDQIPLPPLDRINVGLTPCREGTMLDLLGVPGALTRDCSAPQGPFTARVRHGVDVGPFKVSGLDHAVERLRQMFAEVAADNPALHDEVRSDGVLCVRARRLNPARYSNHSWGTAIDIFFGKNDIPQGVPLVQRGVLALVPYFNRYGWYWGGGFSGDNVDSMHFELAEETVRAIAGTPLRIAGVLADGTAVMPLTVALAEPPLLAGEAPPFTGARPPVPAAAQVALGEVSGRWNHKEGVSAQDVPVLHVPGTAASHFMAKLAVDADGAPRAYHPENKGSFDWLANITKGDRHGIQGTDAVGPAEGFFVSATSLADPAYPENDTRRYVDASLVPYIVLPAAAYPRLGGVPARRGCLAYVVDTKTGGSTGALFADSGCAVGEGSIALALSLGLHPFSARNPPKVVGFDEARFFYLVFHDTHVGPPWPVGRIQTEALAAFEAWGGEAQLRALVPDLPTLSLPREVRPYEPAEALV
ncbi:MAG: M15 family metallopeptidase [Pseudomonadota bacterium]